MSNLLGNWYITPHAIKKFQSISHINDWQRCKEILIEYSKKARFIKVLPSGCKLYKSGRPHMMRFVVADKKEDRLPQLLTVL